MRFLIFIFLFITISHGADLKGRIETLNWNGLEVVYVHDDRFPTFDITIYFGDGALSDEFKGESNSMFSLLEAGTRRYNRNEINESLDFYGIKRGPTIFHEFSLYYVSGLEKDLIPTMKRVCHLFDDSVFPKEEIKKELAQSRSKITNLLGDPEDLANRAFRELSLTNTPFSYPVEGKLKDLSKITQAGLKRKLKYYNEKVKKKIFIAGPRQILSVQKVINEECGWNDQKDKFVRNSNFSPKIKDSGPQVFLVTVPSANQAQIRVGRFLNASEIQNEELLAISSGLLGGGFTSQLMLEVRQKRGLTYGINAYASRQKDYGRSAITTSTKNDSIGELLTVVKDTVQKVSKGDITSEEIERAKGYLIGGQFFRFENSKAFLNQLVFLDHYGKPFDDIFKFGERIQSFKNNQITDSIGNIFGWDKQVIMVLGTKDQEKKLSKFGKVKIIDYKNFL
ncbi:MAG: M16 family metallopeptidase [Bacteriovoracales bacterium]|jgi:zinc protease